MYLVYLLECEFFEDSNCIFYFYVFSILYIWEILDKCLVNE